MLDFDTAEYRRLSLLAAGVSPSYIPPILDTATWRRLLIAALINNTSTRAISGQVDYYADLPTEIGIPTIGATFLVKYSSGIYLINYKSAGVYIKVADTGSLTDWVYAPLSALSTLPDVTLTSPQIGDTLVYNGTRWINRSVQMTTFTTVGSSTWTIPTNAKRLRVRLIGGGGGGAHGNFLSNGGGGPGGGGGAMSEFEFDLPANAGTTATIIVGSGGFGGVSGESSAGAGGASTMTIINVGTFSANGGAAGSSSTSYAKGTFWGHAGSFGGISSASEHAGAGGGGGGQGAGSTGPFGIRGLGSNPSFVTNPGNLMILPGSGGTGGSGAGGSYPQFGGSGSNGSLYGGGGGGGGGSFVTSGPVNPGAGGNGRQGAVVIWTYF